MDYDYGYDEDIVGEAPCEFCGLPFPLVLLIQHQTSHFADDDFQFFDQGSNNAETEDISKELDKAKEVEEIKVCFDSRSEPEVTIEKEQSTSSALKSELKKPVEAEQIKSSPIINEPKVVTQEKQKQSSVMKNEKRQIEKIKEFTMESGEKLLVYGSNIDPDRDSENDKELYKMPSNPLLSNLGKDKDVEDINNLSDDDNDESLEEFWKRARDVLKRNRIKSDCA